MNNAGTKFGRSKKNVTRLTNISPNREKTQTKPSAPQTPKITEAKALKKAWVRVKLKTLATSVISGNEKD